MAHPVCGTAQDEVFSYFQRLWFRLLDPDVDLGSKLEYLFAEETKAFGLEYAFLSRIDLDEEIQRFDVLYGPDGVLGVDDTIPLGVTYCRKTIEEPDGTMAISDAPAEGWDCDPAYEEYGVESYVGTTVTADNELYGTLCFANTEPRDPPITENEVALVDMLGQWVTYEMNHWMGPPTHETPDRKPDEQGASLSLYAPELDAMLGTLSKAPRRLVLLTLLDTPTANSIAVLEQVSDQAETQIELQHIHFPKLVQAGYIEWDRDANTFARGPNFEEIEPLLRLLTDYTEANSE